MNKKKIICPVCRQEIKSSDCYWKSVNACSACIKKAAKKNMYVVILNLCVGMCGLEFLNVKDAEKFRKRNEKLKTTCNHEWREIENGEGDYREFGRQCNKCGKVVWNKKIAKD